jgi:hypothetical protein
LWDNNAGTEKLLIPPPEICAILPAVIWQQTGGKGEGNYKFGLVKYFYSLLQVIFICCKNLTTLYLRLYFPSEERRAADFYVP